MYGASESKWNLTLLIRHPSLGFEGGDGGGSFFAYLTTYSAGRIFPAYQNGTVPLTPSDQDQPVNSVR